MLESNANNNLPYWYSSNAHTAQDVQTLLRTALDSDSVFRCTLYQISPTRIMEEKYEPMFDIQFGHFGFHVHPLTAHGRCFVDHVWNRMGRIIDQDSFFFGLFQYHGLWRAENISYSPMSPFRYRAPQDCAEPFVFSHDKEISSHQVLIIHHPFGYDEVLPYKEHQGQKLVARWFYAEDIQEWVQEWVHLPTPHRKIAKMEVHSTVHVPIYPLQDDNALVSDFLGATELYIPSHYVPILSTQQKIQQLQYAMWWMENRFRVVPRFPKWRLDELIQETNIHRHRFRLPMSKRYQSTTEILKLCTLRGNPILRWLTTRSTKEETMKT